MSVYQGTGIASANRKEQQSLLFQEFSEKQSDYVPLFRPYREQVRSMLNPQRYHVVKLKREIEDTEWFGYNCFRRPNVFSGKITYGDATVSTVTGIRGGGKSSILKNRSSRYRKVIGVYGSRDDEVLDLLRMNKYTKMHDKGLIVRPSSVDVKSSWNTVTYDNLTLHDIEKHDVIVAPQKLFPNPMKFFEGTQHIVDVIWGRPSVTDTWFLLILEAANILYSRMFLKRAKIDQAKAYLILLIREMRHIGVAMGLDSQRAMALDKEVREQSDYTYLKNMGSFGLPQEMKYVYKYLTPNGLRSIYPNEFACIDKWGGIYLGRFKLPPWHKSPKEDIYKSLGITMDAGDTKSLGAVFDDDEDEDILLHDEIMSAYFTTGNKAIKTTARITNHDKETVRRHIKMHLQDKSCHHWKDRPPVDERDTLGQPSVVNP